MLILFWITIFNLLTEYELKSSSSGNIISRNLKPYFFADKCIGSEKMVYVHRKKFPQNFIHQEKSRFKKKRIRFCFHRLVKVSGKFRKRKQDRLIKVFLGRKNQRQEKGVDFLNFDGTPLSSFFSDEVIVPQRSESSGELQMYYRIMHARLMRCTYNSAPSAIPQQTMPQPLST